MKAVVFHDVGDICLEDVPEPPIEQPVDAVVRITASAICGTDLHMIRGTLPGMKPGTILGHEGVGVVEEVGKGVRNFRPGDRVVVPSTIACGWCSYCRAGYTAQCDVANPNGPQAGTAFYGGPALSGPFMGMQAEYVRVPYAAHNLVRIPHDVTDEQALLCSATRWRCSAAVPSGNLPSCRHSCRAPTGCWRWIACPTGWRWCARWAVSA